MILTQWYWLSRQNNKQIQTRLKPISSGNALYCSFKRRQLCINQKSVDLSNNSSVGRLMIWTCKPMVAINLKMVVAQILYYMYEAICINLKNNNCYIIDTEWKMPSFEIFETGYGKIRRLNIHVHVTCIALRRTPISSR